MISIIFQCTVATALFHTLEPAVFFAGNKKCFKTCCPLLCRSDYHISFCSWHFLFPCSFLHFDTAFMSNESVFIWFSFFSTKKGPAISCSFSFPSRNFIVLQVLYRAFLFHNILLINQAVIFIFAKNIALLSFMTHPFFSFIPCWKYLLCIMYVFILNVCAV